MNKSAVWSAVLLAVLGSTMAFAGAGGPPGGGAGGPPGAGPRAGRGPGGGGARGGGAPAGPRGPAPTLTTPKTPTATPDADGFIRRWTLLEPIQQNGMGDAAMQAAVKKEYFPGQFTIIPKDGEKVTVNGGELTWHAVESSLYNINLLHFAYALNRPTSGVLFWAVTVVNSPEEMKDVRLAVSSNAASVWWLNGDEIIGLYGDRHTVIDDGVSKKLTLKKGPNIIRVAVNNGGGATDFLARFLDKNEEPIKNLTISLSVDVK